MAPSPGVLLRCSVCQAHRGPHPGWGSYSVDWALQALKGASWVGSYSVVQCIKRLMHQPLYCSPANAGVLGGEGYGDSSTLYA